MAATELNVIALISGGKDSLFSISHCVANGHNVVALANLFPGDNIAGSSAPEHDGSQNTHTEDIDSYMYQTVGHSTIPLYAEALELPLYRQAISGTALDRNQAYNHGKLGSAAPTDGQAAKQAADETECLVPLLQRAMRAQPEINALCAGAILSSYQRTRVESVASRLGLVSLAFLWQYPVLPPASQSSLLEDMAAAGLDARIIKVASGGLDTRHLWLNIADPRTVERLKRDMGRVAGSAGLDDGDIIGEGGEFETLAIDGPPPVWKGRIAVADSDIKTINGSGGTAALRIARAVVVRKTLTDDAPGKLHKPALLDPTFEALLNKLRSMAVYNYPELETDPFTGRKVTRSSPSRWNSRTTRRKPGSRFVASITPKSDVDPIANVTSQTRDVIERLRNLLLLEGLSPENLDCIVLLLRRMPDFHSVNEQYQHLFTSPNPPARIALAVGDSLPQGIDIVLLAEGSSYGQDQRQGLHVQSRSYWAPANIGPYSQAISVPVQARHMPLIAQDETPSIRLVHVAGQIPLVPASMSLLQSDMEEATVLSLQHLWRVGRAMGVQWWAGGTAFVAASSDAEAACLAKIAIEAWNTAHEKADECAENEAESDDIADLQLRRSWFRARPQQTRGRAPQPLPDWTIHQTKGSHQQLDAPPCFVAQVDSLPRGAPIEWYSKGLVVGKEQSLEGILAVSDTTESYSCVDDFQRPIFAMYGWRQDSTPGRLPDLDSALEEHDIAHVEALVTGAVPDAIIEQLGARDAHIIPCSNLWGRTGRLSLAYFVRYG